MKRCENCGQPYDFGARYCAQCGNVLSAKPSDRRRSRSSGKEPSYWLFVAIIAVVFVGGLVARAVFSRGPNAGRGSIRSRSPVVVDESLDRKVHLVALNFRCACGGCGELLFTGCKIKSPYEIIQALNRACPNCGKTLTFDPDKIAIVIVKH